MQAALLLIPIPPVNGKFFPKYKHFFNMSRINLGGAKKAFFPGLPTEEGLQGGKSQL
jgi:hypothetical protein